MAAKLTRVEEAEKAVMEAEKACLEEREWDVCYERAVEFAEDAAEMMELKMRVGAGECGGEEGWLAMTPVRVSRDMMAHMAIRAMRDAILDVLMEEERMCKMCKVGKRYAVMYERRLPTDPEYTDTAMWLLIYVKRVLVQV